MKSPAVLLEVPTAARREEFLAAVRRSVKVHGSWVRPPATPAAFAAWLARAAEPNRRSYLVCRKPGGELVGYVNLGNILRGPLQSAFLGYYAFAPWHGQGLMTAGLTLVLRDVFRSLKLHRVEANIQPGNTASQALARRLGFRLEGFSPRYLKIAGRWRDHERWALLIEDWRNRRSPDRSSRMAQQRDRFRTQSGG